MKHILRRAAAARAMLVVGLACWPGTVVAATFTWDGGGADNKFSTAENWDPDTAGVLLNGNDFVFGPVVAGGQTTANADANTGNPSSFTFAADAPAMTISGNAFQLAAGTATPIANNSSNLQSFTNTVRQFWIGGTATRTWSAATGDLAFGPVDLRGDSNGTPTAFSWVWTGAANMTFNNTINFVSWGDGETVAVSKTGTGTVTLKAGGAWNGGTTISAGAVALEGTGSLPDAGALTVSGGTFNLGTVSDTVGAVSLLSGTITGTSGVLTGTSYSLQAGTLAAQLGGTGTVTKSTAGTVVLQAAAGNAIPGDVTVAAGNLRLGAANQLADTSVLTFSTGISGRLQLQGFNETLGGIQDSGGANVRIIEAASDGVSNAPATLTLNVATSQSYSFGGYLRNASGATNSALTVIKEGAGTQVFSGGGIVNYSGATTVNNGVLEFAGATVNNSSAIDLGASGTIRFNPASAVIRSAAITGSGTLEKSGASTLTLSGPTSFTGPTNVQAGVLALAHSGGLAGTSGINVTAGARLDVQASGTYDRPLALNGNYSTGAGDGSLRFNVNGGSMTWSGPITLGSDTKIKIFSAASTVTLGAIGGAGNLAIGAGGAATTHVHTLNLNAQSTYTGSTLLRADDGASLIVNLGVPDALPTATQLTLDGGAWGANAQAVTLNLNGFDQSLAKLTTTSSGGTASTKTINLTGTGTGDVLSLSNPTTALDLNTAAVVNLSNLTLNANAGASNSGVAIDGDSVLNMSSGVFNTAFYTRIGGVGAGTLNLTGGTTTNPGEFLVGFGGAGPGTLNVSGTATVNANFLRLGDGANATLNLGPGGTVAANFLFSNTSGTVNFNGGTLMANTNPAAAGASWFTDLDLAASVQAGGAVIDTNNHDLTVGVALAEDPGSPGGGLAKQGAGTLTLAATSTYSGTTSVTAGTLYVNGSLAHTSAVNVASNATLGGTGSLAGPTTIQSGATLAPGTTSVGTLTITDTLGLNPGSTLRCEIDSLASFDRLTGLTGFTMDGTLALVLNGFSPAAGDSFDLVDWSAGTPTGSFFLDTALAPLNPGLTWDASNFLTTGTVAVVPEPSLPALLFTSLAAIATARRRRRRRRRR